MRSGIPSPPSNTGFDYAVVGAPVIIADGLRGDHWSEVAINGKHFGSVRIAGDILAAESMIVLSHVKGHDLAGFGGRSRTWRWVRPALREGGAARGPAVRGGRAVRGMREVHHGLPAGGDDGRGRPGAAQPRALRRVRRLYALLPDRSDRVRLDHRNQAVP